MPLQGRRINMFARDLYRYGLLGRFIGILHAVARLHGKKLDGIVTARTPAEQRDAIRHAHRAAVRFEADPDVVQMAGLALRAGHSAGAV